MGRRSARNSWEAGGAAAGAFSASRWGRDQKHHSMAAEKEEKNMRDDDNIIGESEDDQ